MRSFFGVVLLLFVISAGVGMGQTGGSSPWVATWGTAMFDGNGGSPPEFTGQTLRLIVHSSVGGSQVRVWLSNRFGRDPLQIGAAHVAVSQQARPEPGAEMSEI